MSETQPLCFIVGPIGSAGSPERKLADFVMKLVIKEVVTDCGYRVKRADEDARPGSISQAVIRDVLDADLVIADLTGFNPNVFYELGIRHSTGKAAIHLLAENVKLPFDNIDQRTIFVDPGDAESIFSARERLKQAIAAIKSVGYHDSNPVTQAKGGAALEASGDTRDQQFAALVARVRKLERQGDERAAESLRTLFREAAASDTVISTGVVPGGAVLPPPIVRGKDVSDYIVTHGPNSTTITLKD